MPNFGLRQHAIDTLNGRHCKLPVSGDRNCKPAMNRALLYGCCCSKQTVHGETPISGTGASRWQRPNTSKLSYDKFIICNTFFSSPCCLCAYPNR
jgi:hypothetical protein